MKKNKCLLTFIALVLVLFVSSCIIPLTSCSGCTCSLNIFGCSSNLKKYQKKINNSLSKIVKVDHTITITDNDMLVFELNQTTTLTENNIWNVESVTKKLSETTYALDTTTKNDSLNVDLKTLVNVDLNVKTKDLTINTKTGQSLDFTAKKAVCDKIMKLDTTLLKDDAHFAFLFENDLIKEITCSYITTTDRVVSIRTAYYY